MRSVRTRAVAAAVAVLTGLTLALFSTSAPAVAFFSGGLFLEVEIEESATLVARGAAVDVPLEITCNATGTVSLFVTVTQRVGGGIASGSGFADVACSGAGQRVIVRVTASPSGRSFKQGTAVVEAEIFGCRPDVCGLETDTETVTLQR